MRSPICREVRLALRIAIPLMFVAMAVAETPTRKQSEQLHFSAEDSSVHNPIAIPKDMMDVLRQDEVVRNVLESEGIPPEKLPQSWFSAAAVKLSQQNRDDIVIVGNAPVSGGNTATFWVFRFTPHGYKLVMTAPAHDLILKKTRSKGYRDLELVSLNCCTVSTVWLKFDGKKYREHRSTSKDIN